MSKEIDSKAADDVIHTKGTPLLGVDDRPENEHAKAAALEGTYHGMTLPNEEDVRVGSPGCQRCEVTPLPMTGAGVLHLRFAHTHTLGKSLAFLSDSAWHHSECEGTLSIRVPADGLALLLSPLMQRMSSIEQRDARARFQPDDQLPQAVDPFEITALPNFVSRLRSAWLLDILRERRLHSVFQPIIRCAENKAVDQHDGSGHTIYGYECLMRAEVNGKTVTPVAMLEMARNADLLFQLDLAARRTAIVAAAEHSIQEKIFINFTPNSIYNPYSCLNSTVRMIDEIGFRHEQIVFEIIESERLPEMSHLKRIVNYYRENGFGVALDDVGAGFSSLGVLVELRPDYVKLDRNLLHDVHKDATKAVVVRKLLEAVRELNLKTVAEGIETEDELDWACEHGADFVQGYLFARPSSPPPLLLRQQQLELKELSC